MPDGTPKTLATGRARRVATWAVILTAVAVHGSLWSISDVPDDRVLFGDEQYYWQGATRLEAGEAWHSEPLWPPLYPRFLAVVLAAGGSIPTIRAVQTLMLLAVAWLLRDLTFHLTSSRFAGNIAGALTLTYPPLVAFAHYLWPEILHLLLFTGALWTLVRRPNRLMWLAAAGALLGLTLLTKSLLGPFLPLLLLPLVLEGTFRDRALRVLVVGIMIAAVVAPTVISNHRRATGVVIANSMTFNLWVGLNERSRKNFIDPIARDELRIYSASASTFPERDAILWAKIKVFIEQRGIFKTLGHQLARQPFRLLDKDSFLTDMLPGGAIATLGHGYREPPATITRGLKGSSYLAYSALLIGSAFGIAICPPRGRRWLLIASLFIVYNLAIFMLLHVKSRYRVPILPFLFLYSGCAAAWAGHRLGFDTGETELWAAKTGRGSWWAASLAALLLLLLAFGG